MSETQPKPSGKAGLVVAVLVVVIAVAALAWYWEPISYYTRLKMWDKAGPGRAVMEFLDAGAKGDQAAADRKIGTKDFKPLVKKDKWVGYQMVSLAGTVEYLFTDLTPKQKAESLPASFITRGDGAAEVEVPDKNGKNIRYRLIMAPDGWRITEIRGGRTR